MSDTSAAGPVRINWSASVTAQDVVRIADGAAVALGDDVLRRAADDAARADALAQRTPVYGRSTGVGANRSIAVVPDEGHGLRLLRSHAVDAGERLPARAVRALIAVRLVQLARPGSGIGPAPIAALAAALSRAGAPEVRAVGGVGTGDLPALAALALALAGERKGYVPEQPVSWTAAAALPFMSSNALTVAQALLASHALRRLDAAERPALALLLHVLRGDRGAFTAAAATAAAAPRVVDVAAEVRALLDGPEGGRAHTPARIQDPYALRTYPQVQGALLTQLDRLDQQVAAVQHAAQENPLLLSDDGVVVHHGAFFQAQLAIDLDAAAIAVARASTGAHARIRLLNEPAYTGRRPFLAAGPEGASGLMMLEYTAAAALAEARAAAFPAATGTAVLSRGAEEDAGFAAQGARQLERATDAYRLVLACELLGAARLIGPGEPVVPARLARAAQALGALQPDHKDQDLSEPLDRAAALLDSGL